MTGRLQIELRNQGATTPRGPVVQGRPDCSASTGHRVYGENVALLNQRAYSIDLAGRLENLRQELLVSAEEKLNVHSTATRVKPVRALRSTLLGLDYLPPGQLYQPELFESDNCQTSRVLSAWASSYFLPMLVKNKRGLRKRFRSKKRARSEEALVKLKKRFFLPSLFQS